MPQPAELRPLLARLKWRQLALVVALDERRSLRQAAADLAMTQPAATKLLRDLEDAVGHPLFARHPWGMSPTPYGTTLVRYARGLTAELDEARRELAALAAGTEGTLRVGGVTGAMPGLLAPAIRRMQGQRPRVAIHVLVNTTEVLMEALRQGRLDVAVCPVPVAADRGDIDVQPLGDEPLVIVARRGHPLARSRRVAPAALARLPWIVQTPESPLRRDTDAMLTAAGLRLPPRAGRDGLDRRHARAAAGQRRGHGDAQGARRPLRPLRDGGRGCRSTCRRRRAATSWSRGRGASSRRWRRRSWRCCSAAGRRAPQT